MQKYRLSEKESNFILEIFQRYDPGSQVYLYGSRTDLKSRGGDIDLLVISESLNFTDKLSALSELKEKLGDQKIDLSILNKKQFSEDVFFNSVSKVQLK